MKSDFNVDKKNISDERILKEDEVAIKIHVDAYEGDSEQSQYLRVTQTTIEAYSDERSESEAHTQTSLRELNAEQIVQISISEKLTDHIDEFADNLEILQTVSTQKSFESVAESNCTALSDLNNIQELNTDMSEKEYLSINEYQHFTVDTKVPVSIVQHELNNENHSKNQAIINETVNVVDKSSVKPQNHIIDQTYKLTKMKEEDAKSENPFIKQSIQTLPQMIQQHLYHVENTGEQNQCSHNNQYNGSELYCNDCRNKRKRGNCNSK
ncbi:unnamed protein product [Heterobilharzia americana]|nr:unnamed protein product [Heterobilharzia americana]